MQIVVKAIVVGRSMGDNNVYTIENAGTGEQLSLVSNGIELELGAEGEFIYSLGEVNKIINFEPVAILEEEIA
jgi:hypothetical protein